jgi:hypothetical protein
MNTTLKNILIGAAVVGTFVVIAAVLSTSEQTYSEPVDTTRYIPPVDIPPYKPDIIRYAAHEFTKPIYHEYMFAFDENTGKLVYSVNGTSNSTSMSVQMAMAIINNPNLSTLYHTHPSESYDKIYDDGTVLPVCAANIIISPPSFEDIKMEGLPNSSVNLHTTPYEGVITKNRIYRYGTVNITTTYEQYLEKRDKLIKWGDTEQSYADKLMKFYREEYGVVVVVEEDHFSEAKPCDWGVRS